MNTRQIQVGTADVSVVIRIIDATDGTPETGVVFNTAGIDLQYRREGATSTAITEATLASLSAAHSDGGFLHIGNGYYRLDLPDAACASGATGVLVHGTVTGMIVVGTYVELVAYNPYDSVRLGLTALPNAAAAASGGLFTRGTGAGQINQNANGRIDVNLVTAAAQTVSASGTVTLPAGTLASTTNITGGTITTVTNLTNAPTSGDLTATMKTSIATAIFDSVRENSVTFGNLLRRWNAVLLGKANGLGTTTANYRDLADGVNRVSATVDADGNRSAVTFNDT